MSRPLFGLILMLAAATMAGAQSGPQPGQAVATTSGYTGGQVADPAYEQVSISGTGHAEAAPGVGTSNSPH